MKNHELIANFICGDKQGKASNLTIEEKKLINYSTCIAYNYGFYRILLNSTRYSMTTTRNTNIIKEACPSVVELEENLFNEVIETIEKNKVDTETLFTQLGRVQDFQSMTWTNEIYKTKEAVKKALDYEVKQLKILVSGKAIIY